jgi:2-methylcitrate dehydratase PrpD
MGHATMVREYVLEETLPGRATVVGDERQVRPEGAALTNGTAGHAIEIDDYHLRAQTHAGCVAVPPVLAMAEHLDSGGHDTVTALVLAFETMLRVARALQPSMTFDRGFHGLAPPAVFGAALGVGRLVGLDPPTMASALGLAGSHASGTAEHLGSGGDAKRLHAGMAAMGGLRAVNLAQRGFLGPRTILEGDHGILRAFAETTRPEVILDGLGDDWEVMWTCIKPFLSAGQSHAPIEAWRAIIDEAPLDPRDIDEIVVSASRTCVEAVGSIGPHPRDLGGALFSLQYSLGMTLVLGGNDLQHYRAAQDAGFELPEVIAVAERVRFEVDPVADAAFPDRFFARVRLTRRDGSSVERESFAPGTPDAPLSSSAIRAKYRRLASVAVDEQTAARVELAVDALADDAPARDVLASLRDAAPA